MLVGGVESLTKLAEKRLYGEVLNPLQAITEVNHHFQQFSEVAHIKTLSDKVAQIHAELATQITEDFKNVFTPGQQNTVKMSLSQLADACRVVSVLEPKVKRDLLKWFINLQLQEYVQLFHENQDIAWLDKIDKRYAWIKRHLLDFEDKFGKIFPLDWEVSERITVQFCHTTHEQLTKLMARRRVEIDVKLLLYAIGKTTAFEALLAKRFTGITLQDGGGAKSPAHEASARLHAARMPQSSSESPAQSETEEGIVKPVASPFTDLIGSCFKPHLDIYTDSIDKNLAELIEQFLQAKVPADPVARTTVFPSCADLFVFYKKCMVQCVQLSNGKPMYDLAMIFKKYLREYAAKILESRIPKLTTSYTPSSISTSMSLLTRDLQNLSTAAGQVIHSFLKEGEVARFTKEEIITICCILTTAEYCLETVQQLEDKLKEKVDAAFTEKIDLGEEKDVYHRIISNCIQYLVQDLETGCEPALIVMSKIQWQTISNVGDQSTFVNSIISHFKQTIPTIRDNLATSRKYYIQFCHKFVNSFIPKYINHLYKCRLTSVQDSNVLGCEQLLLDTHSLKTVLLDLPSIGSQVNRKAPASFTKIVIKGMTKAEMIIKVVMAPVIPANVFTEQFLKLLPDSTLVEFHKVLDMKGMRRVDQAQLAELFKRTAPKENLSLALDAVSSSTGAKLLDSPDGDKGRIKKLEKLIKKRLPN
uniref:Vacuolar protein sorting-associated protein 53 homolog n=2 Tax=Lutzomyia longipalpis TaxID=7200 RepID=A0A1B0CVH7_LUTLO